MVPLTTFVAHNSTKQELIKFNTGLTGDGNYKMTETKKDEEMWNMNHRTVTVPFSNLITSMVRECLTLGTQTQTAGLSAGHIYASQSQIQ